VRIGLVTCVQLPEPDPDAELLLSALRARGADPVPAPWDDPSVDWAGFDRAVIRSTWNYHHHRDAFVAWAEAVEAKTDLRNSARIVRWNSHKRYIQDLADRGAPAVPTAWIDRRSSVQLDGLMDERGWTEVVVKPAVSGGSFSTHRFDRAHAAQGNSLLAKLLETRDMMIQPYVPSVEGHGERSVVMIDGVLTHTIRKRPRFGGEHESVSQEALPIEPPEREAALAILGLVSDEPLLYARIDLARDASGRPMLMELELIEPSLFLLQSKAALDRFADAIVRKRG
jgi:glutathione synthase/RimK-type ligase-like ATP-grasp enzyme